MQHFKSTFFVVLKIIFAAVLIFGLSQSVGAQPSFPEEPAQAPIMLSAYLTLAGGLTGFWFLRKQK